MRVESSIPVYADRCGRVRVLMTTWALGIGVVAGIAALAFPGIDLAVAGLYYGGNGAFVGQSLGWVVFVRSAFVGLLYLCIGITIAGLVLTWSGGRTWLRFAFPQWLFLAVCLVAGPGLVANVVLKDNWGRARPSQVVEFGGTKTFTPPLIPARQCAKNCSFISGEASSMFVPLYALGLLMPQSAVLLLAAGSLFGLAAGLVRISQGGHFLSDVIFAGVFMALTVALVHAAMFRRTSPRPA